MRRIQDKTAYRLKETLFHATMKMLKPYEGVIDMKHTLPALAYAYDALEPHIDAKTMEIHHSKHHQAYINNYVGALEGTKYADLPVEEVLKQLDSLPAEKQNAVRNNGGGYYNHSLFWTVIGPNKGGLPSGALAEAIEADLGGFEAFKKAFSTAAATRFGSGWAWLVMGEDGKLKVTSTPNQDVPFNEGTPILGLDVWEHAYYLNYQNRRPDYVAAFFNVIDWNAVSERYQNAQ